MVKRWQAYTLSIAVTIISGAIISMAGPGPEAFLSSLYKSLTTPSLLGYIAVFASILAIASAGLAPAYKAGFITIGVEAQITASALTVLYVMAYLGYSWPAALVAGSIVSIIISLVVYLLRVYARVNEVLSSLMMNYIIVYVVNAMVSGPLRSGAFTKTLYIDRLIGPMHAITAAVLMLAIVYWLDRNTILGVMSSSAGKAPLALDTYAWGIPRAYLATVILQSATAAVSGFILLTGLQLGFTALSQPQGYGYASVLLAWMSELSVQAILPASLFFAWLAGAGYLLQATGLPSSMVILLQSIALGSYIVLRRWEAWQ